MPLLAEGAVGVEGRLVVVAEVARLSLLLLQSVQRPRHDTQAVAEGRELQEAVAVDRAACHALAEALQLLVAAPLIGAVEGWVAEALIVCCR